MSLDIDVAAELDLVREDNERLRRQLHLLQRDNRQLAQHVELLMNRLFGKSSEKIDPDQLRLFEAGSEPRPSEPESELAPTSPPRARKPKGHGRASFPAHLDRIEIACDVAEEERVCSCCGVPMNAIGEDVCERGHVIPARVVVNRYAKKKYACPQGHEVKTGEAPAALIDRCKYEPSVYAQIATAKYADHLPLTRQETIFKRQGMPIAKSTMGDMILRCAELVEPVVDQMRREVLSDRLLHADETPITVLTEGEKGQRTGFIWTYAAERRIVFDFTTGRGREGPIRFLGDYAGVMVADGYSGYDEVERRNGIVRAGCWSHARRKFKEAFDGGAREAAPPLRLVAWLYRIEKAIELRADRHELSAADRIALRLEVRRRLSRRVLARIERHVEALEARRDLLPKSPLGKAVSYLRSQWSRLVRFLDDAIIPLDNNLAERALRAVALGRKNWMFAGSERGAHAAAVLYSLTASCRALEIDTAAYVEDVLVRISTTKAADVAQLTPWAYAERRATAFTAI